jgi:hypothetical protein
MTTLAETVQRPSSLQETIHNVLFPVDEIFKGDIIDNGIPIRIAVGLIPTELLRDLSVDISKFGGGNGRVDAIVGVNETGTIIKLEPFTDEMRKTAESLNKQYRWDEAKKYAAIQKLTAQHI